MTATENGHEKINFGGFRLEAESRTLWRDGAEVHLAKRPFDVLRYLIENRERVISRDELLDKFWDGCDVYDDALRKTVGAIRHALCDTGKPPRFIETRYGSGYRFIGVIKEKEKAAVGSGSCAKHSAEKANDNRQRTTDNRQRTETKDQKPKTEDSKIISELRNRKVFLAILAVVLIALVTLGFYVYFPDDSFNSSTPSNLVEAAAPVRSIAVLPLKNLTGDANNEYFSDGVTESIIAELSRVNELAVISRSSTFALKGKEIDPREIKKRLSVDALLEGGVQKRGDNLIINLRLVSTSDGRVLWTSQNFERPLANAYELQDTIACNIARELRAELCDGVPKSGTANGAAYQAYLQGRFYWNKRTGEGIKKSIEFYEQALRLDKNYALAYAGLAESYVQGIWHVPFAPNEVLPKAKAAGLKAVELDDKLAEAHTALAGVYGLEWDWSKSRSEIERAVELNPRNARARHVQAFCFLVAGRNDEAVQAIERARELDPLNLVINTDKAQIFFTANRNEEAFRQWEKALELDPNFALAYQHRATANQVLGNESAAIEDFAKMMELNGQPAEQIVVYRQIASRNGLKEIYRKDLKDLLAREKRGEPISPVQAAWLSTALGQTNEAFKYLEKIYAERSAEVVIVKTSRLFDSLNSDSRFADLLKRSGLSE